MNQIPTDLSFIDTTDHHGAALVVWAKPYCRRADGKWMLYLTSERRHSVAISEKSDKTQLSEAQQHLLQKWLDFLDDEESIPFIGNYHAHDGPKNHLAYGIDLYVSTAQCVGTQSVPEDGIYIVRDGKLFAL